MPPHRSAMDSTKFIKRTTSRNLQINILIKMNEILEIIGYLSSIATLIGFVIGFIWNKRSNSLAQKANLELYRKFAESIISTRIMEIDKVNLTIGRLRREADTLDIIRKRQINNTKDEEEREAIEFEYDTTIQNLRLSVTELEQFATNPSLESVFDVDKVFQIMRNK